ncbi:ulp1 protease family, C-terminal catalytic domain-containing protein [Tanacetum coccineum]|uniref:Ulp1 protease family, C-terminal catalytic domain-containing protein n=1 Tax=Tanacetum coccineum TaxID=301880 RepID=A0ABQ5FAH7_9ASTR
MPLTTHDGKVIPDWKEDLFRPKHAQKTRTIVPAEISDMLQDNKDKCLYFPWINEWSYVCSKFWESLLALGKEWRGWLSDTHLDIWVLYVWHYRPAEADWAICCPFLTLLCLGIRCCLLSDQCLDNHWILVEFYIRSCVITFYDSLPPENLIVEDRKWWMYARQVYADKLLKLLIQSEVMEKENIDPSNYSISYRYAVNVPRQGKFTGDYGIWVIRDLYMLLNNLPLEVSNPTQAGLAYREHLIDFFWKYKIAK